MRCFYRLVFFSIMLQTPPCKAIIMNILGIIAKKMALWKYSKWANS